MSALAMYGQANRYYHNFNHIGGMLRTYDEVYSDVKIDLPLTWRNAIVYHDCFYEPGNIHNETISAKYASKDLSAAGVPDSFIDEVVRLIHLTANHVTSSSDVAGSIIIDLDLSELAGDRYKRNSDLLRKEFGFFTDGQWREGRVKWLKSFLSRPQIYYTEHGQANWETPARENMQAELDYLTNLT